MECQIRTAWPLRLQEPTGGRHLGLLLIPRKPYEQQTKKGNQNGSTQLLGQEKRRCLPQVVLVQPQREHSRHGEASVSKLLVAKVLGVAKSPSRLSLDVQRVVKVTVAVLNLHETSGQKDDAQSGGCLAAQGLQSVRCALEVR